MRLKYVVAWAFGVVLLPAAARAHVELLTPPPRQPGQAGFNQLKLKPCGQTTNQRTNKVTTFAPGQQVEVKMKEYIDHPGYFAVAFDEDGDDSFVFPRENMDDVTPATDDPKALFPVDGMKVLGIRTDKEKNCASEPSQTCTLTITIPNVNCQNCTLQLTQFMYDKVGNNNDDEYYYQCADIKIEGPLAPGGGGAAGASSGGAAGTASGGTASAGTASGGTASAGTASGGTAGAGTASGGTPGASGQASGGAPGASGSTASAGTASSGAAAAGTGAGGAPSGGAGPSAPPPSDDGGCTMSRSSHGAASLLGALGLAYAALRRRRVAEPRR